MSTWRAPIRIHIPAAPYRRCPYALLVTAGKTVTVLATVFPFSAAFATMALAAD